MKMLSKEQMTELKVLSMPLIKFLSDNFDPHTSIVVDNDYVRIVSENCGVPVDDIKCKQKDVKVKKQKLNRITCPHCNSIRIKQMTDTLLLCGRCNTSWSGTLSDNF